MQQRFKHSPRRLNEQEAESVLEHLFDDLIAKRLGVEPDEITPKFINDWRDEHLYLTADANVSTKYGGYVGTHKRVLTLGQIRLQRVEAETFWSRFSPRS